jgi:tetratricopeptide (TPR) repeat protein
MKGGCMIRSVLLGLIFAVFAAVSLQAAQQATGAASPNTPTQNVSPNLTPRQQAELRADRLLAGKEYENAAKAYQQLLVSNPRDSELLNKTGLAYQEGGDYRQAERFYKLSAKADKTFIVPVNNLGTIEYGEKRYRKSIRQYKKALKLHGDPEIIAAVYSNIGNAYFSSKQYPEAMDSFRHALALNPEVFQRHTGFGSAVQQRDIGDRAMFDFLLAKTYAQAGNVAACTHYLVMARDDGYKNLRSVSTDPDFARVVKDPAIQQFLASIAPDGTATAKAP